MEAFLDLVNQIFPSVRQETVNQAKAEFIQFNKNPELYYDLFDTNHISILRQGDIFDRLPFQFVNSKGAISRFSGAGILISNTCDSTRNAYLQFAPFIPISQLASKYEKEESKNNFIKDLKKNTITQYLYLHHNDFKEGVFDLSLIASISRKRFEYNYHSDTIKKLKSLNAIGYYVMLIKISLFLMRTENFEETERYIPVTT